MRCVDEEVGMMTGPGAVSMALLAEVPSGPAGSVAWEHAARMATVQMVAKVNFMLSGEV